jgi:hypothetical protein
MTSTFRAFAFCAVGLAACKGDTVKVIDPDTKTALDNCLEKQNEQKKLITSLQEENTRLQTKQTSSEVVVTIEGNVLTVKPGKPGTVPVIDDAAAKLASQEFIDLVRKSRGSIQKCYEQVLKKTPSLQSKPIKLTVSASFSQGGAYQNASFAPTLGDTFDNCIRAVATKWTLSQKSQGMTYQTTVELLPS